jgi:hypothetical protein
VQNQQTGAAAAQWGRETAKRLARALGASIPIGGSNECKLDGQPIVIKCAAATTDSVGVTFAMLKRVARIIAAFQTSDSTFEVWSLTPKQFESQMRDTASKGASAGKVGLVRRTYFEKAGTYLGTIAI